MSPKTKKSDYKFIMPIQTRWMDNDVYGHVNNVIYYSYFDTIVNGYLIEQEVLDIQHSAVIGLVVETQCNYFAPIMFPNTLEGGLRVAHIGKSSVRYEIAIFNMGDNVPSAEGHFVHVYVDRITRRPTEPPDILRDALNKIMS